ncbi:hypothetical protein FRC08_008496 [Ceratobasidium sp. 394]|nr:hypothetical protein FRC08_008496 [Ceratobasidium sp. 394]
MLSTRHLGALFLYATCVATQSLVNVDDSLVYSTSYPGGIQFWGSSWLTNNTNNDHLRFNGTSHVARALGDNFIFSFRGSSISWYADGDKFGGPITILLDGFAFMANNYAPRLQLQRNLWTSPSLDSGDHQIIVINTGGTLVGLDNLAVTPNDGNNDITPTDLGPGASNIPAGATLVDDTDSSVSYNGPGWQSSPGAFFQGSTHYTSNPGDSCTFTFTGTQLFYFTSVFNQSASLEISIDGGSSVKVDTATSGITSFVEKLVWSSPTLNAGQHTVMVTHAGNAGDLASIDFFMYGSGYVKRLDCRRHPSWCSYINSSGGPGSSNSSGGSSGSKSVPTVAIIGAAIGGGVLLIFILLVVLILRRRRRTPRPKPNQSEVRYSTPAIFEPFPGKEGTLSPAPQSTLNYGSGGLDSPGLQTTAGGVSVRTNFTAPGYHGFPEVQG